MLLYHRAAHELDHDIDDPDETDNVVGLLRDARSIAAIVVNLANLSLRLGLTKVARTPCSSTKTDGASHSSMQSSIQLHPGWLGGFGMIVFELYESVELIADGLRDLIEIDSPRQNRSR